MIVFERVNDKVDCKDLNSWNQCVKLIGFSASRELMRDGFSYIATLGCRARCIIGMYIMSYRCMLAMERWCVDTQHMF